MSRRNGKAESKSSIVCSARIGSKSENNVFIIVICMDAKSKSSTISRNEDRKQVKPYQASKKCKKTSQT